MGLDDFKYYLERIKLIEPKVIFWEPINARGTNGKRMIAAGLDFARSVMSKNSWAECFVRQWKEVEEAAKYADCIESLHIWPDPELKGYVNITDLEYWWHKPTVEQWNDTTS
ncbi:hypothetical protein LC593_15025 [Nostoc sp. CHAB 5844]|nr:hypothetical protein [Nostoc sp. CHAB 5844]